MAISDTLWEAVEEIRGYLKNHPSMYGDVRPRIESLLVEMDQVRVLLDTPPAGDPSDSAHSKVGH
jgi:hypothetical protein